MSEPKIYYIRLADLEKPQSEMYACYPMVHYYELCDLKFRMEEREEHQHKIMKIIGASLFLSGISLGFFIHQLVEYSKR
jgi:hypothetical protein